MVGQMTSFKVITNTLDTLVLRRGLVRPRVIGSLSNDDDDAEDDA